MCVLVGGGEGGHLSWPTCSMLGGKSHLLGMNTQRVLLVEPQVD